VRVLIDINGITTVDVLVRTRLSERLRDTHPREEADRKTKTKERKDKKRERERAHAFARVVEDLRSVRVGCDTRELRERQGRQTNRKRERKEEREKERERERMCARACVVEDADLRERPRRRELGE
jgi:hypothetical protein